jgi:hypothetical protein
MTYVIYNKETTRFAPLKTERYATERAAKTALTRGLNEGQIHNRNEWAISETSEFFHSIEKTKTVRNLMSGLEVEIGVNTPIYCDPSSETYWSM